MAKTNVTSTQFAAKKLLGKTQTRPSLTDAQEALTNKEGTLVDVKIVATKLVSTKVKLENDGENKTSSSEPKRQAS